MRWGVLRYYCFLPYLYEDIRIGHPLLVRIWLPPLVRTWRPPLVHIGHPPLVRNGHPSLVRIYATSGVARIVRLRAW